MKQLTTTVKYNLEQYHRIEHLTEEQKKNPMIVLKSFFDNYHLHEVKEEFWNILTTVLSSDSCSYQKGRERGSVIFFYEQSLQLFEAAFLILNKVPTTPKVKAKQKQGKAKTASK